MNIRLEGLYPAVTTPFKNNGDKIDQATFEKHINWLLENDVDGIVVLGSTGEAPLLTKEERREIIHSSKKYVGNKLLIAGVGGESLIETLTYSRDAEECKADGLLVITPYYYKISQEDLFRYYTKLCEKVGNPVILYNFPRLTGLNIELDTLNRLLETSKIIGMKDSSGDMVRIIKLIKLFRDKDKFILNGNPFLSYPSISMGAHGLILAAANILPKPIKAMIEYIKDDDQEKALKIYWEMYEIFQFTDIYGIPGIKIILNKIMNYPHICRSPIDKSVDYEKASHIAEKCKILNKEYA